MTPIRNTLFAILLFMLAPTSVSWAAIAFVQDKVSFTSDSGNTQAITWTSNTTNGHFVVCAVMWSTPATRTLTGVTDSQGNTYTLSAFTRTTEGPAVDVAIVHAFNITVGTTPTVTATFNGSGSFGRHLQCAQFSGIATASALDQAAGQAQNNPGTGTDAVTSGTVVTTQADELIIGATCCMGTTPPGTAGTSFTMFPAITTEDANSEYRIVSSTGTYAGTFTADGAADDFATRVATFKMLPVTPSAQSGGINPAILGEN